VDGNVHVRARRRLRSPCTIGSARPGPASCLLHARWQFGRNSASSRPAASSSAPRRKFGERALVAKISLSSETLFLVELSRLREHRLGRLLELRPAARVISCSLAFPIICRQVASRRDLRPPCRRNTSPSGSTSRPASLLLRLFVHTTTSRSRRAFRVAAAPLPGKCAISPPASR